MKSIFQLEEKNKNMTDKDQIDPLRFLLYKMKRFHDYLRKCP